MASTSEIYSAVSSHYSAASTGRTANGKYESTVAQVFGYSDEELSSIPQDANLGLSCGNPHVLAALRPGETVVDLGSGAGFDVFLAAAKVGPTGHAIGVDMNKDMLSKANQNRDKAGAKANNVTVVEAPITDIHPLDGGSLDCIISNCVVNLVPEEHKRLVFREMFRLLKPGRRVAISDILIKDGMELPKDVHSNMALLVGCIAGASHLSAYEKYLREASFNSILIADNHKDLNVYKTDAADEAEGKSCCGTSVPASEGTAVTSKSCCGVSAPASASATASKSCCGTSARSAQSNGAIAYTVDLSDFDFNTYAGSSNIYAVKA